MLEGIKKCSRNCKNMLKKSFRDTFFPKSKQNRKNLKMSKEKHIKAYMFLELRLKCFRNMTTFCYFSLMQNRQQEQDNHLHQFNIFLSHIATSQIKDIQPWVFVCHKPYNSEVEILKFLSNFEHRTWHKFRIFLSKNDKNSKNEEFLSRFLRILNSYVFSVTPIFWSSETILAEVTAIWHSYTQKWKNLQSLRSTAFWPKLPFFVYGHALVFHTFLSRP